jgi:hypothetical protein
VRENWKNNTNQILRYILNKLYIWCLYYTDFPSSLELKIGHETTQLVETLHYKPEGRGFYSRRGHRDFSLAEFFLAAIWPWGRLTSRCGWVVNTTLRPFYPWQRDSLPIVQETGWAARVAWTGAEYLTPTGFRAYIYRPVQIKPIAVRVARQMYEYHALMGEHTDGNWQ